MSPVYLLRLTVYSVTAPDSRKNASDWNGMKLIQP